MKGPGDMGDPTGFSGPSGAGIGPGETSSSYGGGKGKSGGDGNGYGYGTHDDSYGQSTYGKGYNIGTNEDHARAMFNATKGITTDNPYGEDGFFSRVFGIDPSKISYASNASFATRQAIANNQFSKYANPQNIPGQIGYNPAFPTAEKGKLRSGVQKAGYETQYGTVMEQYAEQSPMDMAARGVMGLFGGLPGLALSQLGTKEYGLPGQPGFESFNPNNPRGPQTMLGKVASLLTGGVDPTQAAAQAAAGIQSLRDRFSPSTPMPGVMPVSPPDRPARNPDPLAGFEQRFNRPPSGTGTGDRPSVSLTVTPNEGLRSLFTDPTTDRPVPSVSINDPSTAFKEDLMDAYLDSRERQMDPTDEIRQRNDQFFGDRLSSSTIGFPDVNRRRVGVLDDLGMTVRQLGENIVAVPGGYMNTETGRTYSGQYNPNARARTFTGTQQPQGTTPFSFNSFIQNIMGQ